MMIKEMLIATLLGTTLVEGCIILRQRSEYNSLFSDNGTLIKKYINISTEYITVREEDLRTTEALKYILKKCEKEKVEFCDFDFIILNTLINE